MKLAPAICSRSQRTLNLVGNAMLTVALVAILFKLGPALKQVSPWVAFARAHADACIMWVIHVMWHGLFSL